MYDSTKTASFLEDWNKDEWQQYLENLYDKISHGILLSDEEEASLRTTPTDLLREVDQNKSETEQLPPETKRPIRVKRVTELPSDKPPLSEEERQEIVEESPEGIVLNTFFPEVWEESDFFLDENSEPLHSLYVDASLNTLLYLKDLGFTTALWQIGPEHKSSFKSKKEMKDHCKPTEFSGGIPVCDFLNGRSFPIDELLSGAIAHSDQHAYYPLKPIIAQTHPGCKCHLVCWQPSSPEEIPDTAPGVPTFGDDEEKLEYKKQIFNRIGSNPITVDRWTVLSKEIYKMSDNAEGRIVDEWDVRQSVQSQSGIRRYKKKIEYEAGFQDIWVKRASESWSESIKPIALTSSYVYRSILGPIRPIPHTYIGFQTNISDEYSLVYLGDMNRSIVAPIEYIQEVHLKENPSLDVDAKTFVKIDDSFGIVIKVFDPNKILCYLPEFGTTAFVDSVIPLEIV